MKPVQRRLFVRIAIVAAMADVYGPGNVGVVHFDAHADASEQLMGHLHSHGTPIRRLIDDEHVPGHNFVHVGLRGGETIWLGPDMRYEVIHAPGHSAGQLGLWDRMRHVRRPLKAGSPPRRPRSRHAPSIARATS